MANVKKMLKRKDRIEEEMSGVFESFHKSLFPMRRDKDIAIQTRKEFKEKRRFNQLSKTKRVIWMTYHDEDTPCSKISKYFDKYVKGELQEFRNQYALVLTDLNNQLEEEEGGIDEAGYRQKFKQKIG